MRLERAGTSDPAHDAPRHTGSSRRRACAPVSGAGWCLLQGERDHPFPVLVRDCAGRQQSRCVQLAVHASLRESAWSLAPRGRTHAVGDSPLFGPSSGCRTSRARSASVRAGFQRRIPRSSTCGSSGSGDSGVKGRLMTTARLQVTDHPCGSLQAGGRTRTCDATLRELSLSHRVESVSYGEELPTRHANAVLHTP